MHLLGIGTATPANRFTQDEVWEALARAPQLQQLTARAQNLLCKVLHADNGIETRHFAVERLEEGFDLTPDALHARFARGAPRLATDAAREALSNAGLGPADIDGIVIATCTGYLCPGLTSYVSEALGLRPSAHTLDLVGHGCAAAVPALRAAEGMIASGQAKNVLAVCVEVCSAAFYLDNDPGVLISDCLFGDGAGAVVLSSEPSGRGRSIEWLGSHGLISHEERDFLRFETRGGMLRNLLSREVPQIVSRHAATVLAEGEKNFKFNRNEVTQWIVHAGGRDILAGVQPALALEPSALRHSAEVLRDFGNVSSSSVLFVMERALAADEPGGLWWLTTFGAGIACYGALLKVSD